MARTTHVKAARQRYATVPVLNEDGTPKQTAVMRNGVQRVTKRGKPVFMAVTVADKSKPLPNHKCGKCGKEIQVGQPYKHITPKSGPYGGRTLYRCGTCPSWQVWEYSSSLSARVAQIVHDAEQAVGDAETPEDVQSAMESAAEEIRSLAEEKRESATNIEDGFGHETYLSTELNETADSLDSWADDVEQADIPELPEPDEGDCDECDGTGEVEVEVDGSDVPNTETCDQCEGTGLFTPDEPTDEQMDDWRSEVEDAVSVFQDCPV